MSDIRLGYFTIYHKTNHEDVWNYEDKYFEEALDEIIVYEDKWGNVEKKFPTSNYKIHVTKEDTMTPSYFHAEGPGIKTEEEYVEEHFWDDIDKPQN